MYPTFINLFPDLYVNSSGAFSNAPFQMTLLTGEEKNVPFVLPRDSLYNFLYFRYDVTALLESEGLALYVSALLTDVAVSLTHTSGGNRTAFTPEQTGVFQGINQGFAQVRFPYVHPKEGSLSFTFQNLYPGTRYVNGWIYGVKVAT